LNHQNLSIERYRVRGTDHPASKSQPPRAKAPRGRDFARACHDGPDAIVRHTAVFFAFAAALSLTNCKEFVREMWERAMRAGIVASCFALALLTGGCDPARDFRYTREGIGTDLYWDGLPAATQLQDIYLANMCAQAISPTARSLDPLSCDGLNLASRDWGLLVQAGMNDIDLRCDSYLSWLHDKKSSREPILKELAVLGGAAAAILRATDVGATPIALTAIAFGIAAESFTNYDLRILSGVDYTTVQSVVRGNRTQFRSNNLRLVIDNRPAAIYVLRNYLSICLPASIEMSINNTVNVYHRGGPEALRTEQVLLRTPVATGATSATVRAPTVVIRTDRPPPPPPPVNLKLLGGIGDVEINSVSIEDGKAFQRTLCIDSVDGNFGPKGSSTRIALQNFLRAQYYPKDNLAPDTIATDADLRRLRNAQATFAACRAVGLANAFEVGVFSRPVDVGGTIDPMKNVSDIVVALEKANIPVPSALRGATFGPPVTAALRQVIPQLRQFYNLQGPAELDRPLYNRILRAGAPT
jgi:hypothetical protein